MQLDAHDVSDEMGEFVIRGQELVLMDAVIARLRAEFPDMPESRLRAVLTREWEATTGGWPVLIPPEVEVATRRVLRLRR